MSAAIKGALTWSGERDSEGHRTWNIAWLVLTDSTGDGPAIVMQCPGLPAPGTIWLFDNDIDVWAFCYPDMKVSIYKEKEGDPNVYWRVEQKFSTKPIKRCQDTPIEDPLMEPPKISGSFTKEKKRTKGGTRDRFGNLILNSSFEPLRGISKDDSRPNVKIEMNNGSLDLPGLTGMRDKLNDAPLWGLDARTVKLGAITWERKLYGSCNYYYTIGLEFEIDFHGWDKPLLDEGDKVLAGEWRESGTTEGEFIWTPREGADPTNPSHYIRATDLDGNPIHCTLNGHGIPITSPDEAGEVQAELYDEANLLELGIPTTL